MGFLGMVDGDFPTEFSKRQEAAFRAFARTQCLELAAEPSRSYHYFEPSDRRMQASMCVEWGGSGLGGLVVE